MDYDKIECAKIRFSNGDELLIPTGDVLIPFTSATDESAFGTDEYFQVLPHSDFGLAASVLEFTDKYPYFYHEGSDGSLIFYCSRSIVSVENAEV